MATQSNTPNPPDHTLKQILAALQAIATAVDRGSDVLVNPSDDRPPSQEQSTTILDYLVLRELVGRQADQTRRTVAATRLTSAGWSSSTARSPQTATKGAVFTRRSIAPDEVADISDIGSLVKKLDSKRASGLGIELDIVKVPDGQPIVRLELRQDDDLAVALGPRLAPVTATGD